MDRNPFCSKKFNKFCKAMERKWLDRKLELNSDRVRNILKSYFDENEISSGLSQTEIDNVFCLFTSKLLDTPDCITKESRVLTYREIFEILIKVFDTLNFDEDNLTLECYKVTEFFYTQNNQ